MKVRNGFVSNSSSSSFVLLGIEMDDRHEILLKNILPQEKDEEFYEWMERIEEKTGMRYLSTNGSGNPYFGFVLDESYSDGDGMEGVSLSYDEIAIKMAEVRGALGEDVEIKLITGQRSC